MNATGCQPLPIFVRRPRLDPLGYSLGLVHIFIDESGTFAPPTSDPSISAVGALIVPDSILPGVGRKYSRLRQELPKYKGEVKGRLLNEHEVENVVTMLGRHQILFEATAIDMAVHTGGIVAAHQAAQAEA